MSGSCGVALYHETVSCCPFTKHGRYTILNHSKTFIRSASVTGLCPHNVLDHIDHQIA